MDELHSSDSEDEQWWQKPNGDNGTQVQVRVSSVGGGGVVRGHGRLMSGCGWDREGRFRCASASRAGPTRCAPVEPGPSPRRPGRNPGDPTQARQGPRPPPQEPAGDGRGVGRGVHAAPGRADGWGESLSFFWLLVFLSVSNLLVCLASQVFFTRKSGNSVSPLSLSLCFSSLPLSLTHTLSCLCAFSLPLSLSLSLSVCLALSLSLSLSLSVLLSLSVSR